MASETRQNYRVNLPASCWAWQLSVLFLISIQKGDQYGCERATN